mmetsp:Transcript_84960/g.263924  ORF Transcript_84960/g.263924 Transcript_84960/m.263924 type:complete len:459 (+) Transcript_84960:28-1404(+)|eukprot:CAMPEP_0204567148 /NCGR_PEP_ID=MMETSP0661-20131031/36438_1 /ASSEMBLY_ACC=CAM_ASM_000606 /TAXON_ID=109239 /ORGANISM="Alexandrium margalefi, Strain AMGDE01CS-322" /LENGTH=458 /DNA_ID=CAMNT_0051575041 /DNA_START=17 /DNA_END=1393 /DNA_ORIENTATION=+
MGCNSSKKEVAELETNGNNVVPDASEDDIVIIPLLESLMEAATKEEPAVTSLLKALEGEFGGELSGLDHKFKSQDSLFRKTRKTVDRKHVEALNQGKEDDNVDISGIVWATTDALRYTMLLPTGKYVAAVKAAISRFEEAGMTANELKNFWPGGDNYQGINDVFQLKTENSPNGFMLFEIQFHTPESFKSKSDSHKFYETFRSSMDPMEKLKNWKALCDAAQKVPVPEGVLEIPHMRSNPNPGELQLYAELIMKRVMTAKAEIEARMAECCEHLSDRVETDVMVMKELEEMLERLVDHDHKDSVGLQTAVNQSYEALNLLVVFPDDSYEICCHKAAFAVEGSFDVKGCRNGWLPVAEQLNSKAGTVGSGPGWSLFMTTPAEDDGVAFTNDDCLPCMVTFHTDSSLKVQELLSQKWMAYRKATSHSARLEVAEAIRQLHESVVVPRGAQELKRIGVAEV